MCLAAAAFLAEPTLHSPPRVPMRNLIKAGLRRLTSPVQDQTRPLGDRHAAITAVAARKGGVGKTTTSVSLAAALARYHGQRVLLVDLDPQGHVSTALKSLVLPGGGSLAGVLTGNRGSEVIDIATPTTIPHLHVTPYDPRLAEAEDLLGTRIGKEYLLREALRATRTYYDHIVIDCPPNLGNLALNGLVAADRVVIPCDPSPLSLKGVDALVEAIETIAARLNPDIDVLGILLTRVDGRNTSVNDRVVAEIEGAYGTALLPVRIGVSTSLAKSQMEGQDIFAHEPEGRAACQYKELASLVQAAYGR